MGLDIKDVRVVINVGQPSSDWILQQQSGRAGHDGLQAVSINLSHRVRIPNKITTPIGKGMVKKDKK